MTRLESKRTVGGSRTARPIMLLLDLLGRRWCLRILWELREQSLTARGLRAACDEASPAVLQKRLRELKDAGLVETPARSGYRLTALGHELIAVFLPLYTFADHWAASRADRRLERESR